MGIVQIKINLKTVLLRDGTTRIINKPYRTDAYQRSIQSDLYIVAGLTRSVLG